MESLVQIPEELKVLLAMVVVFIVTEFLKWVSSKINFDLSGYSAQVAAAIVSALLVFINAVLTNVPAEFVPIVNQIFVLLVVILGSTGLYKKLSKFKGKLLKFIGNLFKFWG
jgi:hypothetical protein